MPQFYPFLNSERERLKSIRLNLADLQNDPLYSGALEGACRDIEGHAKEPEDADQAVVEFTLAKILLSVAADPAASEKYADRKSEEYRLALEKENLTYLIKIAREDFGMGIKTEESLRLQFIDFLEYKPDFLKLAQMNLMNGYVQVTKTQLNWILKGAIKQRIISTIPKKDKFPDAIMKAAGKIKKVGEIRERAARPRISSLREDALPPCIQGIVKSLEAGTANHNAHFVLVTFLHGLGLDEKAIVDIFRRSPKFKEKIASYQVKFAKERGYTCPACDSVKGYGLCKTTCAKKHPISNYFANARRARPAPAAENKK
jgi:DNA primase large subunit